MKGQVYTECIRSCLLYGCETCAIHESRAGVKDGKDRDDDDNDDQVNVSCFPERKTPLN